MRQHPAVCAAVLTVLGHVPTLRREHGTVPCNSAEGRATHTFPPTMMRCPPDIGQNNSATYEYYYIDEKNPSSWQIPVLYVKVEELFNLAYICQSYHQKMAQLQAGYSVSCH